METVRATKLVNPGTSNSAILKLGTKMSKKRGVYVEKWANSKQMPAEDNRRPRAKAIQQKTRPEAKPSSAIDESKLASFTRLLSAPDSAVAREVYKPLSTSLSPTAPKQNSKMSNMTTHKNQYDIKPQRNIIERNKKQAKMKKFTSKVLRQAYAKNSEKVITFKKDIITTSSNTSKITRNLSSHWSHIFPSEPPNAEEKQSQSPKITSRKASQNSKLNMQKKKDDNTTKDGKDEHIYNFFIDLLESVYDENFDNASENPTLTIVNSNSSEIKLEIEENVAKKLYLTSEQDVKTTEEIQQPNRYTIRDDDSGAVEADQSHMLANYYNNRAPLLQQKRIRRPRKITTNKTFLYTPKPVFTKPEKQDAQVKKKKTKKQNLLNLLKEQLTMASNIYEEPENMYQALCSIARNKNKYRQIRFDTPDKESKSDYEGVCRFKRRKVISPSTNRRQRRKDKVLKSDYVSMNTGRIVDSAASIIDVEESNHSLEVYGFDYILDPNIDPEVNSNYSDRKIRRYVRSITNLNQGIKTVTQYWKQ